MNRAGGSDNADPHGVQQLLAILRQQQDGGAAAASTSSTSAAAQPAPSATTSKAAAGPASASAEPAHVGATISFSASTTKGTPAAPKLDVRYASFAQALPILTQLAKDDGFLKALLDLKRRQDDLEQVLANEYKQIDRRTGEASNSSDVQRQTETWSRQALQRWDDLYAAQQEELQKLGVPCFFVTNDQAHRRRQERVFDVLAGLLE